MIERMGLSFCMLRTRIKLLVRRVTIALQKRLFAEAYFSFVSQPLQLMSSRPECSSMLQL